MAANQHAGQGHPAVRFLLLLPRSVCIFFSGGLDCSLLACLLCQLLQEHSRSLCIELATIAFAEDVEVLERAAGPALATALPDRYAACGYSFTDSWVVMSFAELSALFPRQRLRLVEMNVPKEEVMAHEVEVMRCVSVRSVWGCLSCSPVPRRWTCRLGVAIGSLLVGRVVLWIVIVVVFMPIVVVFMSIVVVLFMIVVVVMFMSIVVVVLLTPVLHAVMLLSPILVMLLMNILHAVLMQLP